MFILFGWRGVTLNKGQGQFICPGCGRMSLYEHKQVRRFFTLFFIPIIPLDSLGEYVLCGNCGGEFKSVVIGAEFQNEIQAELDNQYRAEQTFLEAAKFAMYLVALADGQADQTEIRTICQLLQKLSGKLTSEEVVRQELARFDNNRDAGLQRISNAAGMISDKGKEMIVASASAVAHSERQYSPEQKSLVEQIAAALSASRLLDLARSMGAPPPLPSEPPPLPPTA